MKTLHAIFAERSSTLRKMIGFLWMSASGLLLLSYAGVAYSQTFDITPTSLTIYEDDGSTESKTFTVALSTAPSAAVTVTLAQPSNTDVTLDTDSGTTGNQNILTFTTANWNTAQTVTVTAQKDNDGSDDTATINLSADGDYASVTGSVAVTVKDADHGIVVSSSSLTVPENGENSFTVRLNRLPASSVSLTLAKNPSTSAIDFFPSALTFSETNWNIEQTVTVTAADDDGGDNESATLQLRGSNNNATQYQADVTITIDDDDNPAFIFSENALTILEGLNKTFKVELATQPTSQVTVNVATGGTDDDEITQSVSSTGLTFTTSNWSTPQNITVTAVDDSDDGSATVDLTAAGGDYAGITGSVAVSLVDDDADKLVVTPVSLSVDEGGSSTFNIRLAKAPTVSVTVTLAQPSNTDVKVDTDLNADGNQNTLTFTANDFASTQTVTVSAAEDDDAAQGTATIDLTAAGGTYASATGSVTVTVNDNDTAELTIPSKNLSLAEGDDATFTVRLASEPSATVTVTLAQSGTANTDVSFTPATLTFTASDWETTQEVTVTAAEDDTDRVPDTATISLTAAGGDYASVTGSVSVSVADDDITIVTTPSSLLTAREGGAGTNLGVALSHEPSHNIYIRSDITNGSSSDVTRVPGDEFLVFTPENYNVNQNIGIAVAEDPDAVDEGPSSIVLSASGFGYDIDPVTVDINATDKDPADLTLSPESLTINEGETATFEIGLTRTTPLGSGEVLEIFVIHPLGISVDTDERTSGNQNKLMFTSSNWNQPQTIEVSASSDEDEDDETATISFRFAGNANYEGTSKTMMEVDITDSGTQSVILSDTTLQVVEGGESKEITVRLTSPPSANVTVTLAQPSSDIRVDTDSDRAGNQNTLTFTDANWRVPQSVMVMATDDADAVDDTGEIVVTASGGGYNIVAADDIKVTVMADDDDTASLVVSTSYLAINEGETPGTSAGDEGVFDIRLATQPSVDVTVTLAQPPSPTPNDDVTFDTDPNTANDQNTLTFTPSNWSTGQPVSVTAADDSDSTEESATIRISATGASEYASVSAVDVEIVVGDDEIEKVLTSVESLTIDEGEQATFRIRLTKEPSAPVTVTLVQPTNTDVTVDTDTGSTGNQNELTFDDTDWDDWKSVTVRAANDDDDTDDTTGTTISITADGGGYGTNSGDNVTVTVKDDDEKGLTLSASQLSVTEGNDVLLGVRLSAIPSGDVTVAFAPPSNTDVTIDTDSTTNGNQRTLTFTNANWNREQEVTISAAADDDAIVDSATIVISISGSDYTDIENVEVSVSVSESDTAGMTVSPTSLDIIEGEGDIITVRVSAAPTPPSESVTVTLTRTGSADVTFTPEVLTFTASNWNTAQTVGVNAAHDEDESADSATIVLTPTGGGYDDIRAIGVSVSVSDDDAPGITTFPRSMSIIEGRSGFFVVRLSKVPSADVTLTFAQPANTDVTLDTDPGTPENQNTLVFTTVNWSVPQGISVSVATDSDNDDDSASISISASGATEYQNVSTQVPVTAVEGADPNQPLTWNIRSTAPAIPPPSAQDSSTLRVRCLEGGKECKVYFDCSAQDGTVHQGPTPPLTINAWETEVLTVADIVGHVGDWSGQGRGRLTCSVRSLEGISTQVWTRSGDGVLVNNSAILRSVESQNAQGNTTYQVDIESIPSPDDPVNRSNIRIRCESADTDCEDVTFLCYKDDGRLYQGLLGTVESKHTWHLQAPELADTIDHRWGATELLTCEVGTNAPFSVQILTRTGGGGALVNNSASGGL